MLRRSLWWESTIFSSCQLLNKLLAPPDYCFPNSRQPNLSSVSELLSQTGGPGPLDRSSSSWSHITGEEATTSPESQWLVAGWSHGRVFPAAAGSFLSQGFSLEGVCVCVCVCMLGGLGWGAEYWKFQPSNNMVGVTGNQSQSLVESQKSPPNITQIIFISPTT